MYVSKLLYRVDNYSVWAYKAYKLYCRVCVGIRKIYVGVYWGYLLIIDHKLHVISRDHNHNIF